MSRLGKDSPEVVKFMALFARLKDWSDDDPEGLFDFAASDESVRDLCIELATNALVLQLNERWARDLFAAPVDPGFVAAWRDYEARYAASISNIFWAESFPEPDTTATSNSSKADLQWGWANEEAGEQASGIEHAIYWARCEVENDILDDQNFLLQLDDGVAAWDRLVAQHGLDLRGVFRRKALVPFTLVPRAVAARHGSAEKLSMLTNLQQAHDAFIFGTPYSALALMRSIMEAVLRDHYRAEGNDLSERIRNARGRLPRGVNEVALHRLRKLANAILHLDPSKENELRKMDEVRLEKEIVSLLFVLRALIEAGK